MKLSMRVAGGAVLCLLAVGCGRDRNVQPESSEANFFEPAPFGLLNPSVTAYCKKPQSNGRVFVEAKNGFPQAMRQACADLYPQFRSVCMNSNTWDYRPYFTESAKRANIYIGSVKTCSYDQKVDSSPTESYSPAPSGSTPSPWIAPSSPYDYDQDVFLAPSVVVEEENVFEKTLNGVKDFFGYGTSGDAPYNGGYLY